MAETQAPEAVPVTADKPASRSTQDLQRLAFTIPAVLFLLAFFLYPLYLMVELALRDVSMGSVATGPNPFVGLRNFRETLGSRDFQDAVPRTILFVVATVALQITLGVGLAKVLNSKMPGAQIGRALVFFVWLLPPVVTGAIWKFMLAGTRQGVVNSLLMQFGITDRPEVFLVDSTVAMIVITLVTTWAFLPFATIVFMAALQNVPTDLYEAGRVDGAGPFSRFWHITLPFIRPTTYVLTLLLLIYSFKSFDFIFVLTQGGPGTSTSTIPYLAYVQSFNLFDFGLGSATSVVAVVAALAMSWPYLTRVRRSEEM